MHSPGLHWGRGQADSARSPAALRQAQWLREEQEAVRAARCSWVQPGQYRYRYRYIIHRQYEKSTWISNYITLLITVNCRLSFLSNQSKDASPWHHFLLSKISPPSPSTEGWPRRRGCQDTSSSRISRSVFSWPQICSAEVNTGFNLFLLSSIFPQSCETCSKTFF